MNAALAGQRLMPSSGRTVKTRKRLEGFKAQLRTRRQIYRSAREPSEGDI